MRCKIQCIDDDMRRIVRSQTTVEDEATRSVPTPRKASTITVYENINALPDCFPFLIKLVDWSMKNILYQFLSAPVS